LTDCKCFDNIEEGFTDKVAYISVCYWLYGWWYGR